jgi:hypothetical protein
MVMSREENIILSVDVLLETEDAILVDDSKVKVWLPKSQITFVHGTPQSPCPIFDLDIELPIWLATKKALI